MKYDTAGNPIEEPIQNCDCGLTGGCEKCNPVLWRGFRTGQGLFKGLKIDKKDIKEAKKSLFPNNKFFPND